MLRTLRCFDTYLRPPHLVGLTWLQQFCSSQLPEVGRTNVLMVPQLKSWGDLGADGSCGWRRLCIVDNRSSACTDGCGGGRATRGCYWQTMRTAGTGRVACAWERPSTTVPHRVGARDTCSLPHDRTYHRMLGRSVANSVCDQFVFVVVIGCEAH